MPLLDRMPTVSYRVATKGKLTVGRRDLGPRSDPSVDAYDRVSVNGPPTWGRGVEAQVQEES